MEDSVPLKEYIEAQLTEFRRYFDAALGEQRRMLIDSNEALRVYIDGQVEQFRISQSAAQALSDARMAALLEHIEAVRRESGLIHEASQSAIIKADLANEKRFESINAFRAQLADQAASFLSREVAEAQFLELRGRLDANINELRRGVIEVSEKLSKVV